MVLPNTIGQHQNQQRWPTTKKTTQHHSKSPYITHKPPDRDRDHSRDTRDRDRDRDRGDHHSNTSLQSSKKSQSSMSLSSSGHQTSTTNSSTSLPETFGLPSNNSNNTSGNSANSSKTTASSTTSNSYSSKSNQQESGSKKSSSSAEILNEDIVCIQHSPSTSSNATTSKNDEIEIISEIGYSQTSLSTHADDDKTANALRSHLNKYYANSSMAIAAKPQSNFVNNVTCLSRMLVKNDFYASKIRRFKPYSSLKANTILSVDNRGDSDDGEDEGSGVGGGGANAKAKKVILIDDSNEEMHKPWISPELIKLIKHRNLLQAKLNESKQLIGIDLESNNVEGTDADTELLKKFKNLRNKVNLKINNLKAIYLVILFK